MSGRRGLTVAVLLVVTGAVVVLMAATRTFWTMHVPSAAVAGAFVFIAVPGTQAAPATTALGVLGLAAAALMLAASGRWRQAVGGLVLLAGVLGAVAALRSGHGAYAYVQAHPAAGGATTGIGGDRTGWPFVAAFGAALMALGGGLALLRGRSWPGWSNRYDRGAAATASPAADRRDQTAHELWDALDRGEDPTAGPGAPTGPDLPE